MAREITEMKGQKVPNFKTTRKYFNIRSKLLTMTQSHKPMFKA